MSDPETSWWARLQRMGRHLLELAQVRLDLAVVETEVFFHGLITEWLLGMLGVLLAILALGFLGALVVLMAPESARLWALAGVVLTYGLGSLLCLIGIRWRRRRRGHWLAQSRREWRRDLAALQGTDDAP